MMILSTEFAVLQRGICAMRADIERAEDALQVKLLAFIAGELKLGKRLSPTNFGQSSEGSPMAGQFESRPSGGKLVSN